MAHEYRFLTAWLLDADPTAVWTAIYDAEDWPSWWPSVEEVVRLAEGDGGGVGSVALAPLARPVFAWNHTRSCARAARRSRGAWAGSCSRRRRS